MGSMIEETHQIETSDGTMDCFSVHPAGDGAYPSVILYMDAPGIREELRDFCRRIARSGYYALLPNMYYRAGTAEFDYEDLMKPETAAATMKKMFAAMSSLTNELVNPFGWRRGVSGRVWAGRHVGRSDRLGHCHARSFDQGRGERADDREHVRRWPEME